ncbi:MAG: 50S ribosomal protein L22 [Clostridia bacterium]|nr:50S ribosomal protein L22 [Clostridia bacterium]
MAKRIREKTAALKASKDTRPYATARYVRMGATKAKRVLDMIKGLSYVEACGVLLTTPATSAMPVKKVLDSAAANAENNKGLNKDDLYVAEAYANQGPSFKRVSFRGRGGVDKIIKRTCHITIVLDVKTK